MKIATWNVNSLSVRLPQVIDWLAAQAASDAGAIDVLALQELKMSDEKFPLAAFTEAGYQAQWFGQKTYNGVALISRSTGADVVKNIPGFEDEMSRVIAASYPDGQGSTLRVIGAYFPNGQAPDSDKFVYKMRWLTALHAWDQQEMLLLHINHMENTISALEKHSTSIVNVTHAVATSQDRFQNIPTAVCLTIIFI
jgi:exodeoxyribonuclease-3